MCGACEQFYFQTVCENIWNVTHEKESHFSLYWATTLNEIVNLFPQKFFIYCDISVIRN